MIIGITGGRMRIYFECFGIVLFAVLLLQFYLWVVSLKGLEKQQHCKWLGIVYCTLGTLCFFFRSLPMGLLGLILFMLGLRLIAHGLDRINKSIFIDRFDGDR